MAFKCEIQTDKIFEETDVIVLLSKYLNPLDSLLRCQICFEYFDTSMVTKCSHNYCSFCIRRYMQYKSQCPICFKVATEPELRNNRLIDEILRVYKLIRSSLSDGCKSYKKETDLASDACRSYKKETNLVSDACITCKKETDLENKAPGSTAELDNTILAEVGKDSEIGENVSKKTDTINKISAFDGSSEVSCPVCYKTMPEKRINIHLDYCLKQKDNEDTSQRKTLPKLVYHLLSEKEIKKKLKEHGLNTVGDRQTLIKRHKSFLTLYNANCDALNPKPVTEIIREIECQELEERLNEQPKTVQVNKKSDPAVIEKEHESYAKRHQSQFNTLINDIQQRETANTVSSSIINSAGNIIGESIITVQNERFDLPAAVVSSEKKELHTIINIKDEMLSPENITEQQSLTNCTDFERERSIKRTCENKK
ncbi:E3 ubiquitin-protein ligase RAD18-like isoform X2 [Stegodyphus dumicola]|uniref:E3 ubiquitin-protein ligase RAD18-like isoform X2 n=1 Tax=Stegodyphus dumicola TaxID=202533 RepID=UPI0015B1B01B|nr:E3 ubiquitin-protein ligase RAD18-like isoform X2 [Stegodyphus dumicola]